MAEEEEQVETEEEVWDSTKMPPEEELWEGGPKWSQINAWKEQYLDVYVTSLTPEKHFVWRVVNRQEYRDLVKALETAINNGVSQGVANMDNEETIAEMCILAPPYRRDQNNKQMAGTAATLSQQILEASGFVSMEIRQL